MNLSHHIRLKLIKNTEIHYLLAICYLAIVNAFFLNDINALNTFQIGYLIMVTGGVPASQLPPYTPLSISFSFHFLQFIFYLSILAVLYVFLYFTLKKNRMRILLVLFNSWLTLNLIYAVVLMFYSLWNPIVPAIAFLRDAFLILAVTIAIFSAWYWVIDSRRQEMHLKDPYVRRHFIFPQHSGNDPAWEDWSPSFPDYIYLAFGVSTSFSPSDVVLFSRTGKTIVVIQVVLSMVIILMIFSRAISII